MTKTLKQNAIEEYRQLSGKQRFKLWQDLEIQDKPQAEIYNKSIEYIIKRIKNTWKSYNLE